MSAKLLQALTDENPDLQKQIGCMTGIFQIFDRQHILPGKRINSPKRLPSAQSRLSSVAAEAEAIRCAPQATVRISEQPQAQTSGRFHHSTELAQEKTLSKNVFENQRFSTESSRASFSSSSYSSFSSLECHKATQPEPPPFEQTYLQDRSSRNSHRSPVSNLDNQPDCHAVLRDPLSGNTQSNRQPLDIRDVVKDSIYRDNRVLSVRTPSREEAVNHVFKHRDSPRPLQLSKSADGGLSTNGKPKIKINLDESFRVLAKVKEAPWYFDEAREPSRSSYEGKDGSFSSVSKEGRRFSYDGRELSRSSFDSRETSKSAARLRELPRLSLDSRECSLRNSNFDSKSNMILRGLHSDNNIKVVNRKSHTSVVAKLMGLETMPNSRSMDQKQINLTKTKSIEDQEVFEKEKKGSGFSRSSKLSGYDRQDHVSRSPRSYLNEPSFPRSRNPDLIMKPILGSRVPIEPAPWKHQENGRISQKTSVRNREAFMRSPTSQSVYSEIEKRLKDLEFKQTGKDLRALKQILEAMETKKDEKQGSDFLVQKNYTNMNKIEFDQNTRLAYRRSPPAHLPISVPAKKSSSPRALESPIVIMKPAKLVEKSSVPPTVFPMDSLSGIRKCRANDSADNRRAPINSQIGKDLQPKLNLRESRNWGPISIEKKKPSKTEENSSPKPRFKLSQSPSRTQQLPKENIEKNSGSGSSSPRLQNRKLELDKRSRPPVPTSDSTKPRRQPSRQQLELGSPGGRTRPKPINDDQSSEMSSETRNISHGGDEISVRSDSNASLASQFDIEVTSADHSTEIISGFKQESVMSLKDDGLLVESTAIVPEQPSPVSVLDASFYRDELLPSPVKNITKVFEDEETGKSDKVSGEDQWNVLGVSGLPSGLQTTPEINQKKLENIERLVEKLRRLNSAHDETTVDHIASLCENTNPDHRYISEILLASGLLLKDLGSESTSIQFHHSGNPFNPDLFLVLEQTKASWVAKAGPTYKNMNQPKLNNDKLQRKLLFDTVNEILVRKLPMAGQPEPWVQANKLATVIPSGQRLLRELCSEIDKLHSGGLDNVSENEDDDRLKLILKEDVMRGESWTDFHKEVPSVVLDIERLLFKDLVDEIVSLEASGLPVKPSWRRRQLFSK
ncbi:protein LONGIFOLIA 2-like [Aristolochia californica]|uniref:protein LONGIFOLIA 2-like n=1 Tax=Aristolochia californica TaxID=171875 RepID=UPI0035D976C2